MSGGFSALSMLSKTGKLSIAQGLFSGTAAIYEVCITEITFERLSSNRARQHAINLGYSPAINLPELIENEDGYLTDWYWLTGETVKPLFSVRCKRADFFSVDINL